MTTNPARKAARPAAETASPAVAREPSREVAAAPGSVIGHNSSGRLEVLSRSGRVVSRASAQSGIDQFHIPAGVIPPGWSWEWKNETVLGEPNAAYQAELAQVGWEPVMAESYPGVFMPIDYKGAIRKKGMMLMERPMVLTQEARAEDKRRADDAVGRALKKHGKLDTSGAHGVDVNDRRVAANNYVRKSIESGENIPRPVYDRQIIE
jgi:hypothetical protein